VFCHFSLPGTNPGRQPGYSLIDSTPEELEITPQFRRDASLFYRNRGNRKATPFADSRRFGESDSLVIIHAISMVFAAMMRQNGSKQMRFDEKYQLLNLKEDAEAKCFDAREISTGRQVSVFLFVGEQASEQAQLIEQLRTADHSLFPELIETDRNQATPYVVTKPLSGFAELKAKTSKLQPASPIQSEHQRDEFAKAGMWRVPPERREPPLMASDSVKPLSTSDHAENLPAASSLPSGFTQMFQTPAAPMREPTLGLLSPSAPPPQQPAAPPPEPAAGEFTRMFQTPAAPIGEPTAEAAPPPPPSSQRSAPVPPKQPAAPPPQEAGPGEFTRFFQPALAPSGTVPVRKQPAEQGQFTQVFGGSTSSPAAQGSPGQFTRIFETPPTAPTQQPGFIAPSAPPASAPPAGEFTRVFGSPVAEAPTPSPAEVQPRAAPGEYTRMFGAQDAPPPAEPASTLAASQAPEPVLAARQASKLPFILGGIILLLLIAIVVLLVVVSK
jgi:hypothetical protein